MNKFRRAVPDDLDAILRLQGEHLTWGRRTVNVILVTRSMDVIVETGPRGIVTGVVFLLPEKHHYNVVGCYPLDMNLLTDACRYRHDNLSYYVIVSDLETQWHLGLKRNGWTAIKVLRRKDPERDHYLFTWRNDRATDVQTLRS